MPKLINFVVVLWLGFASSISYGRLPLTEPVAAERNPQKIIKLLFERSQENWWTTVQNKRLVQDQERINRFALQKWNFTDRASGVGLLVKVKWQENQPSIEQLGSSFLVSTEGHLLTAAHLILGYNRTFDKLYSNSVELTQKESNYTLRQKQALKDFQNGDSDYYFVLGHHFNTQFESYAQNTRIFAIEKILFWDDELDVSLLKIVGFKKSDSRIYKPLKLKEDKKPDRVEAAIEMNKANENAVQVIGFPLGNVKTNVQGKIIFNWHLEKNSAVSELESDISSNGYEKELEAVDENSSNKNNLFGVINLCLLGGLSGAPVIKETEEGALVVGVQFGSTNDCRQNPYSDISLMSAILQGHPELNNLQLDMRVAQFDDPFIKFEDPYVSQIGAQLKTISVMAPPANGLASISASSVRATQNILECTLISNPSAIVVEGVATTLVFDHSNCMFENMGKYLIKSNWFIKNGQIKEGQIIVKDSRTEQSSEIILIPHALSASFQGATLFKIFITESLLQLKRPKSYFYKTENGVSKQTTGTESRKSMMSYSYWGTLIMQAQNSSAPANVVLTR